MIVFPVDVSFGYLVSDGPPKYNEGAVNMILVSNKMSREAITLEGGKHMHHVNKRMMVAFNF